MSIWSAEELEQLDFIEVKTTQRSTPITVRSPGVCEVTGDGIPRNWDVRQGFGLAGSTQVFMGIGLAEFSVKIRVFEPIHRDVLRVFCAAIQASQPGQPERVYEISHPRLAFVGITKCVFLNDPMPLDEKDASDTITYKCRQWRKPLPALTAPTSPGASSAPAQAQDEFAARVADRVQVLDGLAGQLFGGSAP